MCVQNNLSGSHAINLVRHAQTLVLYFVLLFLKPVSKAIESWPAHYHQNSCGWRSINPHTVSERNGTPCRVFLHLMRSHNPATPWHDDPVEMPVCPPDLPESDKSHPPYPPVLPQTASIAPPGRETVQSTTRRSHHIIRPPIAFTYRISYDRSRSLRSSS